MTNPPGEREDRIVYLSSSWYSRMTVKRINLRNVFIVLFPAILLSLSFRIHQ